MAREELRVKLNEGCASLLDKEHEPSARQWRKSQVI
jgi:hypothetical protein